ncbi:MAG: exodeoxyribonuclease V subunit beta [Lysobacteraceae bacterium]
MSATGSDMLASDVGLNLPLDGLRLIEASAGTGKTFTLATLYLRALLVQRRRVAEVLVMTFTDAATAELRLRLRARLSLAATLLSSARHDPDALTDDSKLDAEHRQTLAILRTALHADADIGALDQHLSLCLLDLDQAPISTLHGFCQRALSEHAFAAGHLLDPGELDGDDRARLQEVCDALWRELSDADDLRSEAMLRLWKSPELMAASLRELLTQDAPLLPVRVSVDGGADIALADALDHLRKMNTQARDEALSLLADSLPSLNKTSYKPHLISSAWRLLSSRLGAPLLPDDWPKPLHLLGQQHLIDKTNKGGNTPRHPLFEAVDDVVIAIDARNESLQRRAIALLHELRVEVASRLAELKQRRRVRSFDDLIDDLDRALADGGRGKALAAAIRRTHPLALVDEFQDTDDRQWRILQRLYVGRDDATLVLVGDPKQAIYRFRNGDIHTYLRAASEAGEPWRLDRNFRSRPSLVAATNTVFGARRDEAFVDPRIVFHDALPGLDNEDTLQRDGVAPVALELWSAPPPDDDQKAHKKDLEQLALDATVADIVDWLTAAKRGEVQVGDDARALRAGDIAVLVGTNHQAARMQQALANHGVAAVRAGQESLFATDEAIELHRVLRALLRDGDGRALRAALATDLIGLDAAAIAALNDEKAEGQGSFDLVVVSDWRHCWRERGTLALVNLLLTSAAPRWLRRRDGARRFANTRHLAELLDEARGQRHDNADVLRWLERRMADADARDETQQPRLETDADRVQVMTVHKSKGLEFGIVYLPFIALLSERNNNDVLKLFRYHDHDDRPRWRACVGKLESADDRAAEQAAAEEDLAESIRLTYVAMTRARWAVRAFWTPRKARDGYGLGRLFAAEGLREVDAADCLDAVAAACDAIAHRRLDADFDMPSLPTEAQDADGLSVARAAPRPRDDWRRHSFSALLRGVDAMHAASGAAMDEGVADDATETGTNVDWPGNAGPAGPGFGNTVHALLESADFVDWQDGESLRVPPPAEQALLAALQREGIDPNREHNGASARQQALRLAVAALLSPLPALEGGSLRLLDLPPAQCQPELEFELRLRGSSSDELLRLLQSHGHLAGVSRFGAHAERLQGLLHGFIDLVYRHGDAFYLLDYKTNRLPSYDDAALQVAMHEHHYDLQYLLYALALHRWLRQRLGEAYEPARHFGGVRYLFLRGRVAGDEPVPAELGVFVDRPAIELLDAMDALFEGGSSGDKA